MVHTITFDEKVKGWTSFHSFIPDGMISINNKFFSIKNGQLWEHHTASEGVNNFYGIQYSSKVTTVLNENPHDDKIFKTIILEALDSWAAKLKTNYTISTINLSEFNKRESKWFAYTRQNEDETDLNGATQGLGEIQSINGLNLTLSLIHI